MSAHISNMRPSPDQVIVDIANYVADFEIKSDEAFDTARNCLIDTLGCGFEALDYPACTKLLGPVIAGTVVPNGAKVPGTSYQLDPILAAFNIGAMIPPLESGTPAWRENPMLLAIHCIMSAPPEWPTPILRVTG